MPTDVRDWTRLHEVEAMARHQLQDATKQDVRRQSPTSPFLASRCVRHCEIKDNVARGEIAWTWYLTEYFCNQRFECCCSEFKSDTGVNCKPRCEATAAYQLRFERRLHVSALELLPVNRAEELVIAYRTVRTVGHSKARRRIAVQQLSHTHTHPSILQKNYVW